MPPRTAHPVVPAKQTGLTLDSRGLAYNGVRVLQPGTFRCILCKQERLMGDYRIVAAEINVHNGHGVAERLVEQGGVCAPCVPNFIIKNARANARQVLIPERF